MKTIEKLEDIQPIKGFKVMEWLRGVRDANYELSLKDPEAYQKKLDAARRRIDSRPLTSTKYWVFILKMTILPEKNSFIH